jgi:predicted kinase
LPATRSSRKNNLKIMKNLILLRGLPGSGKSTVAKMFPDARNFEADMYFIAPDGTYTFDPSRIKDAHEWCRRNVENTMSFGKDVVVSNTFTQEWEMEAYYELAEKYEYQVVSLIVENRHGGKNIHGVPDDKLEIMKNRFEIKL